MKNKYYILIVLLILFFACTKKNSTNQNATLSKDSLSLYLFKANDFSSTIKKRQNYIHKALEIVMNQPGDSMQRVNLFRIANRYYNINDWKTYQKITSIVLEKAESSQDTMSIAKSYSYFGDYYGSQGFSESAFTYYFKSEKLYLNIKEKSNAARTRLNIALLQFNESDFSGSEISVFKALRVIKGEKLNDLEYESYNLLGAVCDELGEYNKGIEFLNKALNSIDKKTFPIEFQSEATSLNNLGMVYQNMNQHKKAMPYFKKGLEHKRELILYKPSLYAMLLDNLAYSRLKLKQSEALPQLFYESLKIREKLNLTTGIIATKIHLSEYYGLKFDTLRAIRFSKEALALARKSKNGRNFLLPLKQLSIIEPKKSAFYSKEYIRINDSLQKADRNIADKFTRIEYETDEIKQENTDLISRNKILIYLFVSIFFTGLFLYIIQSQKAKNRELLFKQQQQLTNEEIYSLLLSQQANVECIRVEEKKRVSQELHDGVLGRLFGVRINLDSLSKLNDESAAVQRSSYIVELKKIEQDIREISHELNREKSELINNFVAIVDNLFEDQKKTFSVQLQTSIDSSIKWEELSNLIKINLYRIIQESLQNSNKYANAKTIKVEIKKNASTLVLQIVDDGLGFDTNKLKKGIGLKNILSRTIECQGTFEIQSKKGEGTTTTITVPI